MKNTAIAESSYQKLLQEIRKKIAKTQQNITRQKVEMAWEIGKIVDKNLSEDPEEIYGKNLILRLESDTEIAKTTLYKMRNFYQSYPELPNDDAKLNWSHYRILAGIENIDQRKEFESLVKKNDWSGNILQKELSEVKQRQLAKEAKKNPVKKIELNFTRGKLFTYKLVNKIGSNSLFADLGFKIFHMIKSNFSALETIESVKKGEKYSFKKSAVTRQETHCYKAFIERVVDGDTIVVSLDLGFGVFHTEILRLAQINAPEKKTKEGEASLAKLRQVLRAVEFLVIKTKKTDIYGRYVADVFVGQGDAETVANEGEYLSQMLLDLGVVEFVEY